MEAYNDRLWLDGSLLPDLLKDCYYVPDFIKGEEEQTIIEQILKTPPSKWTNLSHRRLLSLPSPLTGTARDTLLPAPLPKYLNDPIITRFNSMKLFAESPHQGPNHILVNEYQPGQGIMPHEDGPAYFPITATVSVGGHTVLEIYRKTEHGEREATPAWRILQEPRSLLVTSGEMYSSTLHGIAEVEIDENLSPDTVINWNVLGDRAPFESGKCARRTRISLTYRDVLKVTKVGGALKFLGKK